MLPRRFNSHVSPCGKEGAVFCEDQIVPLCVLRIKRVWNRYCSCCQLLGVACFARVDDEDFEEMTDERMFEYQSCRGNVGGEEVGTWELESF